MMAFSRRGTADARMRLSLVSGTEIAAGRVPASSLGDWDLHGATDPQQSAGLLRRVDHPLPPFNAMAPCCSWSKVQYNTCGADDGQRAGPPPTLAGTSMRGRRWRGMVKRHGVRAWAFVFLIALATSTHAQLRPPVTGELIQRYANGVLGLMAYTIAPDVTTSSLSIQNLNSDNPGLTLSQLGGGFVASDSTRVYLEGNASYARYDPRFVVSDGTDTRLVPTRWNAFSATGGIGYDFPLSSKWSLRPIFNFTVGQVASDLKLALAYLGLKTNSELEFLDQGKLDVYGLGGSLMLVYRYNKPERDIEFEGRYTNVELRSFGSSTDVVRGQTKAQSLILWSRMRVPTGLVAMQRPVRYVFELAHSRYFDTVNILGIDNLTSFGFGVELDSGAYDVIATRWRAVIRHLVGPNVSGWSLGLAVSF
jgi:hypothetical protein